MGRKSKHYFACKRGSPEGTDQKNPKFDSRKLGYKKTIERPVEPNYSPQGELGRQGTAGSWALVWRLELKGLGGLHSRCSICKMS